MIEGVKILGVSHLALTVRNPVAAEDYLCRLGYRVGNRSLNAENPPEKARFLALDFKPKVDIALFVAEPGVPAIEMLSEQGDMATGPAGFSAAFLLGSGGGRPTLWRPGISSIGEGDLATVKLTVGCLALEDGLTLWRELGFVPTATGPESARVAISRTIVGGSASLEFVKAAKAGPSFLDQEGLICLSLLCTDAKRLCWSMEALGYETSPPFVLSPFGRSLDVFFLRNASGEMYEFLSPSRDGHG